jgi:hypothetical protein
MFESTFQKKVYSTRHVDENACASNFIFREGLCFPSFTTVTVSSDAPLPLLPPLNLTP